MPSFDQNYASHQSRSFDQHGRRTGGPLAREADRNPDSKLVHHPHMVAKVLVEPALVSQFGSERYVSKTERELHRSGRSHRHLI